MSAVPLREVVRVAELEGERGGKQLVHVLSCGHWMALRRRRPARQLRCIGCWVETEMPNPAGPGGNEPPA